MPTHPFAIKLAKALEDAIRLRERLRSGIKPRDNGDGTFGPRRQNRTDPVNPAVIALLGSDQPGVSVEISQHRTDEGGAGECVQQGNDRFAILQFLTCRCKKGDKGACSAAAAMQAQGGSGGGGGGGF